MSSSSAHTLISPANTTSAVAAAASATASPARDTAGPAAAESTATPVTQSAETPPTQEEQPAAATVPEATPVVAPSLATSPSTMMTTSPTNTASSSGHPRKHGRTHSVHSHGHGHHHGHTHGHGGGRRSGTGGHTHSSHGHSRGTRRSSEGDHGRRALAAGLTMQALDAAVASTVSGGHPTLKGKRKTSDGHGQGHGHVAHTRHHAHHVHHATTHSKTSRSDSNLTKLSRTPSSSTMSQLTSESGSTAAGARLKRREHSREEVVQVISSDAAEDDVGEEGEEEWESGEETPAPGSRRHPSVLNKVDDSRRVSAASDRRDVPQAAVEAPAAAAPVERGLDLRSPSPGHEPPATQRTTGFPVVASPTTHPSGLRAASARSVSQTSLGPATSATSTVASAASESAANAPAAGGTSFPFPQMVKDEAKETHTDDHASADAAPRHNDRSPAHPQFHENASVPTHPRPVRAAAPAPVMVKQPSHTSLRSIRSLRAPHPLNSPSDPRRSMANSPNSKRVSSLHYPPAAPAVVYRETVGGQGWDDEATTSTNSPTAPDAFPEVVPKPRTERGSSFSSVRSLKGVLMSNGLSTPNGGRPQVLVGSSVAPSRNPSRRLTALQATSAASRLNTTNDPIAYHQSLGFSPATAETAHLLSRFLPTKKPRRPHWVITQREAMEAHAALERGEIPENRIGLTEGEYRGAHDSLVATLRGLAKTAPRRGVPRHSSYGYASSLLGSDEPVAPRRLASGQTPFEASVARCLAQRPKLVA